ncbi:MAG: DNA topoisomerase IV [Christiangramia sp.]|uniref:DNA topoisomerase IV n=1 Tax=Christiangramia sp. TaxID=1931228 RepID=UPI003242FFA8
MRKFVILIVVFSMISCFNAERNCEDFHTGTFEFKSYINGEMVTSTFIRNDSTEIEEFRGKVDTSSIRWINDCEYILKNLHPDGMAEAKAIHMKILTTSKDGYTFEYGQVGDPKKSRGSVTKISE